MKERYASMPDWLFNWLGITAKMDADCFRQHDHDYGCAGHTVEGFHRASTRAEADSLLAARLIVYGFPMWKALLVWSGCRLFKAHKWRRECRQK